MRYPDTLCIFFILLAACSSYANTADTIGWIENVSIAPGELVFTAKIDTGADSSSLHCDCQQPYLKAGEQRIRFSITDNNGRTAVFDKDILRLAKIRRHFGKTQIRPVVLLGICLGEHYAETEVTLIDRSGFNYNLLIGRNFLAGHFLIDPSQQNTTKPICHPIDD